MSDLHLGEGRDHHTGRYRRSEHFFGDGAFARFLRYHDPARTGPAGLILNGDTFDFGTITSCPDDEHEIREWGCYLSDLGVKKTRGELAGAIHRDERRFGLRTNDYKAVWKVRQISRGHHEFFDALGWWVERGGLVIFVKGCHDLELHWPLVQRAVRREIGRSHPEADVERLVTFEETTLQILNVSVEHGHRLEGASRVEGSATAEGDRELKLPLSALIHRRLVNTLAELEPFGASGEPLHQLLWTVARRHPLRTVSLLRHTLPTLAQAFRERLRGTGDLALFVMGISLPWLALSVILVVLGWFLLQGQLAAAPLDVLLVAAALGIGGPYLVGFCRSRWPQPTATIGENRLAQRTYGALHRADYPPGVGRVYGVLGHTHQPDVQRLPPFGTTEVIYVNSGSWTPRWRPNRTDISGRVRYTFLRFNRSAENEYALNYLEWDDERNEPVATTILEPRTALARKQFLSERERKTVEAFTELFIEGQHAVSSPSEIAAIVDKALKRFQTRRTRRLRLTLFVVEYLLPQPSLNGFSNLGLGRRRRVTERVLGRGRTTFWTRELARLRDLFLSTYYSDSRVQQSIGYVPVSRRGRDDRISGRPTGRRLKLADPPGIHMSCDICVIGSGAAGAVVAGRAAASGRDVVLLEDGLYVHSSEITHDEMAMRAALYKDGAVQRTVDIGNAILQGCTLGGSSTVSNAICFRLLDDPDLRRPAGPHTLDTWQGLGAQIDRTILGAAFDRIETRFGVERIPEELAGENARLLLDGWQRLLDLGLGDRTYTANRFRKAYRECIGCGYCAFGCGHERKLSALETFVTEGIAHGARVISHCRAMAIDTSGRNATSVVCLLGDGRRLRVRAQKIVVACGAIASSVLLRNSGIRSNVGSRVSVNPSVSVFARFPRTVDAFDGVALGAFVDTGENLLQSAFAPPATLAAEMPGWFGTHFERMRAYRRYAGGRVTLASRANARIRKSEATRNWLGPVAGRLVPDDLAALRRGVSSLAQIYFAAGAEAVYLSGLGDHEMLGRDVLSRGRVNPGKIARFVERHVRRPGDVLLSSTQPQGGNPISDDPSKGVVDSQFRVHRFDNLFVCDASVFPTSVRIPPLMTVMALGDYAWQTSISQ